MALKKIIKEYKDKGYIGVRSKTLYEGRRRVDLITVEAKKSTPLQWISPMTSHKTKRVHIGTYIPSKKKRIKLNLLLKYAKRKSK